VSCSVNSKKKEKCRQKKKKSRKGSLDWVVNQHQKISRNHQQQKDEEHLKTGATED